VRTADAGLATLLIMAFRRKRPPRAAAWLAAVVVALLLGIWLGGHPSSLPTPIRNAFVENSGDRLIDQAMNIITQQYFRPVNRNQLVNTGLAAMVASLNDPFSHYYSPSAYRSFLNESNPHLSGVGIDVIPAAPRGLRVVDVFPGSPAAKAGLAHNDLIVKVGSTSLMNRSATFASELIRGKAGTRVVLTIVRGRRTLVVPIVRQNLVVPVASGMILPYHGIKIGYVQLTAFTDGSGVELRGDVVRVLHQGARALVLDLRENGGGLLNEAINVASIFIPDGTIVTTRGRDQPTQVYTAEGGAISTKIPMVVLVDRDTASAAEIVTAALKDRGRALVVGTRTYGKGVFQEVEPIANGGALDITVGEFYTPNGQNLGGAGGKATPQEVLQGPGIKPNVYASSSGTGDHALQVAERTVAAEVH
jgi:carboxyl-terminal processing protease